MADESNETLFIYFFVIFFFFITFFLKIKFNCNLILEKWPLDSSQTVQSTCSTLVFVFFTRNSEESLINFKVDNDGCIN